MRLPNKSTIIFEYDHHDDGWWWEKLVIFTVEGKAGYGFYYAVPYSDVTPDANDDMQFFKDKDWEYFYRMGLNENMREIIGNFEPKEEKN